MVADDQKVALEGVGGILVYQDYSNPQVYYYATTRPSIARAGDDYQLTLARYDKPLGDQAGMLSFVVNLEPEPGPLEAARQRLRAMMPDAELHPMPWTSGTVTAAIAGGAPVAATPSLLGTNSAVISTGFNLDQYLALTTMGADALSVVYGLSFEAFREKYEFAIQFDETRFREWIQKKWTLNLLFISFEKTETFEDLKASGVIRVSSLNSTGEEPPEGFQRAFLRSLQSLLTPMPGFAPPPEGGSEGWGIGFDYQTVRDLQNLARRLDTNMRISGAVTRQVYLQGSPAGLAEAMKSRREIELPTAGAFTQRLTIRCPHAFDGNPLEAVNVAIQPPTLPTTGRVFDENAPSDWQVELARDPRANAEYSYTCALHFGAGRGIQQSGPGVIGREQAFLDIVPEAYYTYRRYRVSAANEFPWDLLQSVTLTPRGPRGLSFEPASFQLRPAAATAATAAFAGASANLGEVVFAAAYQPKNGAAFSLEALPSGSTVFLNPFQARRVTFGAVAEVDWEKYIRIVVLPERSNGTPQLWATDEGKKILTEKTPRARFDYWHTGERKLQYKATFYPQDPKLPPLSQTAATEKEDIWISAGT